MTDPHPTPEAEAPTPSSEQRKQTVVTALLVQSTVAAVQPTEPPF